MKKTLVLLMLMLILLSSCKKHTGNAETLPSGIDPFSTSATKSDSPVKGKPLPEGRMTRQRTNPPDGVESIYNGKPIEVSYELLARDTEIFEQGFVVFVEGVPTLFKISINGEMRNEEAYMHSVLCREGIVTRVSLYFEPTGYKAGETVSYYVSSFFAPSFVPYEYYPVYRSAQRLSIAQAIPLKIEAKTKGTGGGETALYPSKVYDIPYEIYKKHQQGSINSLDSDLKVELCDSAEKWIDSILYASGKTDFMLKLYGGPTTKYRVTLFVDHEPVKVVGKDYLECTLVAVAVPYDDTYQRFIGNSQAVLLVNTDRPQNQEDIAPPGFFDTQKETTKKQEQNTNAPEPGSGDFEKFLQDNRLTLKKYVGNGKYIAYCAINKKHCLVNESKILYYNDHYDTDYFNYKIITLKNGFAYVYENIKIDIEKPPSHTTNNPITYIDIYDNNLRLVKRFDTSQMFTDYEGRVMWINDIGISSDGKKICASLGSCLAEYNIEKDSYRTIYDTQHKYEDVGLVSFWHIGYSPDDEYIAFIASYYDGRDTLNAHGFIKTDGSGLEYQVIDGADIEYTFYNKGIFFDEETLPYGKISNGIAYMWEFGTKQPKTVTFLSKNESQSARISKDGSVILTYEDLGDGTLKLVRFRVYAADSMKLLYECELRDFSGIPRIHLAEDGSWFGVNCFYDEMIQRYIRYDIKKQ